MKDQALPSIPENPQVKEVFKQFILHLKTNLHPHSKKEGLTTQERRLDSFARLIEGDGKCTAVYLTDKTIIIASNSIHKGNRKGETANRSTKLIDEIATYFHNLANGSPTDLGAKMILVTNLCFLVLRDRQRDSSIEDTVEKYVQDFFKSNHDTKKWRNDLLLKEKDKSKQDIIKQVSRTARDFLKLKNSVKEQSAANPTLRTFIKNKNYQVLYVGEQSVHAEMRVLQHMFSSGVLQSQEAELVDSMAALTMESKDQYVGISKLCCAHCALTLRASSAVVKTRGQHGQIFEWTFAEVLKNPRIFKDFIGFQAYQVFKELDTDLQKLAIRYITFQQGKLTKKVTNALFNKAIDMPSRTEMYADSSDSDVEYNESEQYPLAVEQYDKHKFVTKTLPKLKSKLLESGIDPKGIAEWLIQLIAENDQIIDLINDEKIDLDLLSNFSKEAAETLFKNEDILSLLEEEKIAFEDLVDLNAKELNSLFTENFIKLLEYKRTDITTLVSIFRESQEKFEALDDDSICEIIIEMEVDIQVFSQMHDENSTKFAAFTDDQLLQEVMSEGFEEVSERYNRIEKRINNNVARQAHIEPIDVLLDNLDGTAKDLWEFESDDGVSEHDNDDQFDEELENGFDDEQPEVVDQQLEEAALVIQSSWRGYLARKEYQTKQNQGK